MNSDQVIFEILKLVSSLPSADEQFSLIAKALLYVSEEQLAAAWANGEFEAHQARLLERFDKMREFIAAEPDLELLRRRAERDRAIEIGDKAELERLNHWLRRGLGLNEEKD